MKVAVTLSEALNELKGSPRYKVSKLCDLVGVYNMKLTPNSFKYCFSGAETILRHRIDIGEDYVEIDGKKYEGTFVIEEIIILCKINNIDLYWDNEVLLDKIFTK